VKQVLKVIQVLKDQSEQTELKDRKVLKDQQEQMEHQE
jgi:hypothetical protein